MKCMEIETSEDRGESSFPQTEWEMVRTAAQTPLRNPALERLLTTYLPFLENYIISQFSVPAHEAKDWLQGFIMEKIIQKNLMLSVDRSRGKFRNFIIRSLHNYVIQQIRRQQAAKRAPTHAAVSFEELQEHQVTHARAEYVHGGDVAWARGLLTSALRRMRDDCGAAGRQDLWGIFEERLLRPLIHEVEAPPYDELVTRFGFESAVQAANALITAKRMFDRQLRFLIAQYVPNEAAVEAELAELKEILFQAAPQSHSPELGPLLSEKAEPLELAV